MEVLIILIIFLILIYFTQHYNGFPATPTAPAACNKDPVTAPAKPVVLPPVQPAPRGSINQSGGPLTKVYKSNKLPLSLEY